MNTVLFVIGIWVGFCTFIGYCCVRVGSTHDDDFDDWRQYREDAVGIDR